jgi:hypothetical protein
MRRTAAPPAAWIVLAWIVFATTGCSGNASAAIAGSTNQMQPPPSLGTPIGMPWEDGQTYEQWVSRFSGYGIIEAVSTSAGPVLYLATESSTASSQGHAALATSSASFGDLNASVTETTLAQLQTPVPDSWDVAWVLWHYTDALHFYYVLLKPDGWELGKEDPAYAGSQRFLATGAAPTFPIGNAYAVQIVQVGGAVQVSVNGALLLQFTDDQTPYLQGNIGLYCEDSSVTFGGVVVNGVPIPFAD